MAKEKLRVTRDGEVVPLLDEYGREIPDPTPMAPPVGFVRRPPLHERIRAMVQDEFARLRSAEEVESFEEADDFVIPGEDGDDPREGRFALQPGFEWEENYEPPRDFREMRERLVAAGWTPPSRSGVQGPEAPADAPLTTPDGGGDALARAVDAGPKVGDAAS